MDSDAFLTHLENEYETELSRLGSSKALYALTRGEMDTETVLSSISDRVMNPAGIFQSWAAATEDESTATLYRDVADTIQSHVTTFSETDSDQAPTTSLDTFLRDLNDPTEQLAALISWLVVTDRTLSQAIGFFVGSADTQRANQFRDFRTALANYLDPALEFLDANTTDWDTATTVGGKTIQAAYDHHVDILEELGVQVKPVC